MLNSYQMMVSASGHLFLELRSHAATVITTVYLAPARLFIGKAPPKTFPYIIATSLKSRRYQYVSKLFRREVSLTSNPLTGVHWHHIGVQQSGCYYISMYTLAMASYHPSGWSCKENTGDQYTQLVFYWKFHHDLSL